MSAAPSPFVHLHLHSQYSLLDGAIRLDRLFERAKTFNMDAVAVTDHGTMFGVLDFYEKAHKAGIKPIIGCECYLAPRRMCDKTPLDSKNSAHLVLLCRNMEGYRNLCRLASLAQLEGFYYKPRIDKEVLKAHSQGLIGLSACLKGEVPSAILKGVPDRGERVVREYQAIFGEDNFFLEVQNNGLAAQERVNQGLLDLHQRLGVPLVATNDCHYLDKSDVRAHGLLLCIQTGKTINDQNRFKFETDQLYFKSPAEMITDLGKFPGAIANTRTIADRCDIEFDFNTYHFPQFQSEHRGTTDEVFEQIVRQGFERRMAQIRAKRPEIEPAPYQERLDYEIKTIKEMGFPGYFLIVADFIRYAKENGIPVGPGRGSAAGSMVAYSLGITDLDPLEHGLIFERFLNPSRISMPDIDVDFCINGRERVFKYVVDRYGGGDYVAQIITFGKLKTRAVIRDVGRALDIPLKEVDSIAKLVPEDLKITVDKALAQEPRLRELVETRADVAELIDICRVLEGLPRHASTHAAGVVIGDKPLVEYLPLYKGKKGEVVTQLDMKRVEQIGLVKFDFLGLRNLTVINDTLELIRAQGLPVPDLEALDLGDAATYDLLAAGDTTGVFQLESSGMKDLMVRLRPASFADIVALVALYRPGPLNSGMADEFVERKHGRKQVSYPVPELEPLLKETYGVIVYQEQVMKIAGTLANYTMAEADGLRKAMGKKIASLMAQHRVRFIEGATRNQVPQAQAEAIFNQMETFGEYGFNKSHSAAYALIAFETAYLKAHYPVEFMAALLTSEMGDTDGIVKFIAECRGHDVDVLPPDINASGKAFSVAQGKIRFGLRAVKNVGEGAIDTLLAARQKEGPFTSLFNLCERVELKKVNKRVIEALIKCGAFDSLGNPRAQLVAALEEAMEHGQRVQRENADPQMGLFDSAPTQPVEINLPPLPDIDEWPLDQLLAFEKEALGFYVSGHPLDGYAELMEKYANTEAAALAETAGGSSITLGGLVRGVKVIQSKKGPMAFVTLEDLSGMVEVTVFSRLYQEVRDLLVDDATLFVRGGVQREENSVRILCEEIIPMDQAEEKWTATIHLHMDARRTDRETLIRLRDLLHRFPGTCKGVIHVLGPEQAETLVGLPDALRLKADRRLRREVRSLLGPNAMATAAGPQTNGNASNGRYPTRF